MADDSYLHRGNMRRDARWLLRRDPKWVRRWGRRYYCLSRVFAWIGIGFIALYLTDGLAAWDLVAGEGANGFLSEAQSGWSTWVILALLGLKGLAQFRWMVFSQPRMVWANEKRIGLGAAREQMAEKG